VPPSIRLATPDDAEAIRAVYAPYCSTPISFEMAPPSVEEVRQRIVKISQQYPWLVCENDAEIWGYVYAGMHRERAAYRWSVDVSVYIQQGRHRLGIGRALYTSLFRILVLQGYVNAYAGATLPNPGSVGLHEAMGFQLVGIYRQVGYKYDAWHDVGWFQLLLQPRLPKPEPPRSIGEVQELASWPAALHAGLTLLKRERPT
jgi:L-amino acid N-acyltransferase YncA